MRENSRKHILRVGVIGNTADFDSAIVSSSLALSTIGFYLMV